MKDKIDFDKFNLVDEDEWDIALQGLIDKGIVKVEYNEFNEAIFSLTELGKAVSNEINTELN